MSAEQALDSLLKKYGDSLAIVAYHQTFSPPGIDTMRRQYYGNPADPTVAIDGKKFFVEDPGAYYQTYDQNIRIAQGVVPYYNLSLNATASNTDGNIQLKIVTGDTIPVGDSIVVFVSVCQDSVAGTLKKFNYVCQILYHFPINLVYPDSLDTTIVFSHSLPVDKMQAVCFIQSIGSKEVMQAIGKKFEEK